MKLAAVNIGDAFKLQGGQSINTLLPTTPGLRGFISQILPNAFIFAGLILLGLILIGAIGMITSAGNPEAQEKSKASLTNAALGFAIIFTSYWIIQIIQVITQVPITN